MNASDLTRPGLYGGIYSFAEAGRLLEVSPGRVRRWADGYSFPTKHGTAQSRPILQTDRKRGVLSFDEMNELFLVREFTLLGVPLPKIRKVAEELAKDVGPFPFASTKILVRGRDLLIKVSDQVLQRPDIGQLVADFADAELQQSTFDDNRLVRRTPPAYHGLIYLDRTIRAGEPVVRERGVPTRSIFGLWEQEKDLRSVSEYFELSLQVVSAAVRYEGSWRLAA